MYCTVTTLVPQIGAITSQERTLSVADIPGLVEGAHANVGRGHKFLQHIERTQVLLCVLDIAGFQLSRRHPRYDAYESLQVLVNELELYCPGLAHERKMVLILNKMDLVQATASMKKLLGQLEVSSPAQFHHIVGCSAHNKMGIEAIKKILFSLF